MQYHDFKIIITIKTNNINTGFFSYFFFQICDSRKIHYLTREFHVKLPLKTGKSVITVPVEHTTSRKVGFNRWKPPVKWQQFSRAWSNYETRKSGSEQGTKDKERRTATLLTCIGSNALDVIDVMEFEIEDQRKDPAVILEKMDKYCIGECNEAYERYVFSRRDQEMNESVEAYVTALRKLAKTCDYGALTDSLIRDWMVVGIDDNSTRKKLLQSSKLNLGQFIDISDLPRHQHDSTDRWWPRMMYLRNFLHFFRFSRHQNFNWRQQSMH